MVNQGIRKTVTGFMVLYCVKIHVGHGSTFVANALGGMLRQDDVLLPVSVGVIRQCSQGLRVGSSANLPTGVCMLTSHVKTPGSSCLPKMLCSRFVCPLTRYADDLAVQT
ncbi:hypothetical protein NEOLEDRAFT_768069 [Neolentinus lepideus HHB14362 ss-1]|uniref:Uncharacterized protein n=1 Tax=Neolentinus lepideus HHB14362 ss-1 TaxID=1314782 RepID=A0A165UT46_9AGAM|nr:hypothetical protein NEOLEDRAFT_768069 [Neolentinus lepideus HHB14362 ss-1]